MPVYFYENCDCCGEEGVTTDCCASSMPTTLFATPSSISSCGCLTTATFTMTWDGSSYWVGTDPGCGYTWRLSCQFMFGQWFWVVDVLNTSSCFSAPVSTQPGDTCDPVSMNFFVGGLSASGGCCSGGQAWLTITE